MTSRSGSGRNSIIDGDWLTGRIVEKSLSTPIRSLRAALRLFGEKAVVKLWTEINDELMTFARKWGRRHDWSFAELAARYGVAEAHQARLLRDHTAAGLLGLAYRSKHNGILGLVKRHGLPSLIAVAGLHDAYRGSEEGVRDAALRLKEALQAKKAAEITEQAKKAAEARHELNREAKDSARKLYTAGLYKTKTAAAKAITPIILSKFPLLHLNPDAAEDTVYDWLTRRKK